MSKALYRWDGPEVWLNWKITDETNATFLKGIIRCLIEITNPDDLQEIFSEEMDEDGYFEEIEPVESIISFTVETKGDYDES